MTEPKQRNMKLVNQHRESIREKFGIPDDKQVEINKLRAVLSTRDAEVREVLEGLQSYATRGTPCWCADNVTAPHTDYCLAAQVLWNKLQPAKE